HERPPVAIARRARRTAPGNGNHRVQHDQRDHPADHDPERLLVHAAASSLRCPARRRRPTTRTAPHTTKSSGTPTRLPHLNAACFVLDSKTSGGGIRFLDRIAINDSACASQSTAFAANARFCTLPRTNRSDRKSASPITTNRPPAR